MKALLTSAALMTLASVAVAGPVKMTDQKLDTVVAGWDNPAGHPACGQPFAGGECGNNGWGNGYDGINPGSYSGGTAPSKSNNGTVYGYGQTNINPTNSNGR